MIFCHKDYLTLSILIFSCVLHEHEKKIDESLSPGFCLHNQLRLKFNIIIARHKKREELAVVKRATCDEQIEFERQNAKYFFLRSVSQLRDVIRTERVNRLTKIRTLHFTRVTI